MNIRPPSARGAAALPAEMVELIRPYLMGECTAEEAERVESFAVRDPVFAKEMERRRWLLDEMNYAYGERRITDGFQGNAERRLTETTAHGATAKDETYDEEDVMSAPAPGFLDSLSAHFGAAPWWVISGSFHALVILLISLIGMAVLLSDEPDTVIVTNLEKQKEPPKVEEVKERTIIPQPVPVPESEIVTEQPSIVTHEEIEVADHVETADDSDAGETRGQDGISDVWLGGSGTVAAIGLGGGGGGAFGRPNGAGGRLRRAHRGGGGKATESAVEKALEWLARHQDADGSWVCRNTGGSQGWDPGITGLATLAFLGAGHTEKVGKYKDNVNRAIRWIISKQDANGAIGTSPQYKDAGNGYGYHTAICGMALAEASAMARIAETIAAAQKAVNYSCNPHQQGERSDKLGFRYLPKMAGDTSCSGWFVMQLKSAKVAGLQVDPASFDGVMKFFKSCEVNPNDVKMAPNASYDSGRYRFAYQPGQKAAINNTAIGILAHLFTGTKPAEVEGSAAWLMETNAPAWRKDLGPRAEGDAFPMYYTYYATLDMFQIGGDLWTRWNKDLKAMLLPNQRRDGDFDGSWDPLGGYEEVAGRAYTTALGAMSLEVYYRYLPLYRGE